MVNNSEDKVDKSREQFEKWFSKSYSCIAKLFRLNSEGEYENLTVRASWRAWQQSRAAIEIELPDSTEFDGPDMSGAQQAISRIRETLTETGIKVKS